MPFDGKQSVERPSTEPRILPLLPGEGAIKALSDDEAEAMFMRLRWPDGPRCKACKSERLYRVATRSYTWHCGDCNNHTSITSGTPFSSRKLPLKTLLLVLSIVQHNASDMIIRRVAKGIDLNYKTVYALIGKAQEFLYVGIDRKSLYVGYSNKRGKRLLVEHPRIQISALLSGQRCSRCNALKPIDQFPGRCGLSADWGLRGHVCKGCLKDDHGNKQKAYWRRIKKADHENPIKERTATQMLAAGPKFPGGYLWDTRSWWTAQEKRDLQTLVKAGVTPERSADVMGRSPSSIVWYAIDLLPTLPKAWSALIAPKRSLIVPATPRLLVYPYLPTAPKTGDEGAALVLAVNKAVPSYLPDHIRAEIAQEMILMILEGEVQLADLSAAVLRQVRNRMGVRTTDHINLRLDDLMRDDDKRSPLEVTMPAGIMSRLEW